LHRFFSRIDRVLRRSIGVSESAQGAAKVEPAPPVGQDESEAKEDNAEPGFVLSDKLRDKVCSLLQCSFSDPFMTLFKIQVDMEEIDEKGNPIFGHDEL